MQIVCMAIATYVHAIRSMWNNIIHVQGNLASPTDPKPRGKQSQCPLMHTLYIYIYIHT